MPSSTSQRWTSNRLTVVLTPSQEYPPSAVLNITLQAFGSSTAPGAFSNISEATFDLAADLIDNPYWDPNVTRPYLHHLISDPEPLEEDIPFEPALMADVELPERRTGGCDGYLDDAISITLGNEENANQVERTKFASIMALDLTFRPNKGDEEPLPRPEVASVKKLFAEGTLKEVIVFLGWLINTRLFQISLPIDKAAAWIKSIVEILNKRSAGFKELATLVGRLNHVCYIIPAARHFINRIRRAQEHADKYSSMRAKQALVDSAPPPTSCGGTCSQLTNRKLSPSTRRNILQPSLEP